MIYRFSIFITGDSYVPLTTMDIRNYPLRIYSDWTKDDVFQQQGKCCPYGYSGSQLLHNSIYAETEEERAKIIRDYIHFLEEYKEILNERGATEVEIAATVYVETSKRFRLLTKSEMEQLLHCGNIAVRLDILCLRKNEYLDVQNDMINERKNEDERL